MLHLWIIATYSFGPAETGCMSQWNDDWPCSFPLIANHKKKRITGVFMCKSACMVDVCACGHGNSEARQPGEMWRRWSVCGGGGWQFSVRRGNGMVLLKLVIRLLWHPACMEDVRGSAPGREEVHRSGSVIFSVSATLSLVHCQSGHGRSISATPLFSLPKCSNICRKMHKPVELWAADAVFVWSLPRRKTGLQSWHLTRRILSLMTIRIYQGWKKTLRNQCLWLSSLRMVGHFFNKAVSS